MSYFDSFMDYYNTFSEMTELWCSRVEEYRLEGDAEMAAACQTMVNVCAGAKASAKKALVEMLAERLLPKNLFTGNK